MIHRVCMGVLLAAVSVNLGCRRDRVTTSRHGLNRPVEATDLAAAADVVRVELTAARIEGPGPFQYAYNGANPGPTIRAKVGDTVEVFLQNNLQSPTTIHWHGVKVPWEMDGVTWLQQPVAAGATFTYRFVVETAGTFWYHPHFDTESQVDAGLYGMLIVEDPREPAVDDEVLLVFDTAMENHEPDRAHGHGSNKVRWLINGESQPELRSTGGTVVRARLLNASNASYLAISWPGLRHIGSDQGLLPALQTPSRLLLGPGDRADVELLVGADAIPMMASPYSLNGGDAYGDAVEVMRIVVDNPATAPASKPWPFSGAAVTPDPGYADIIYSFAGSDRTATWFINGEQFPNVTVESVALGSTAIVEVRNLSPSEHPFHLHGLEFEVLSVNGVAPAYRTIEDTINLRIRDRVRLRVEADNPGDWMAHCHILPHAGDGMMTVLRVWN